MRATAVAADINVTLSGSSDESPEPRIADM